MTSQKVPAGIKPKIVELTPDLAETLLGRNTHNRNVRKKHVAKLAGAMKRGEWQFNGEAIKIADDGRILDGQHRILAVIESQTPITALVIEGLEGDTQGTMDSGRARTLGDALKLNGEVSANNLASALRMVYAFERNGIPAIIGDNSPTTQECIALLERHPNIRESVKYASAKTKRSAHNFLPASVIAGMHYIFSTAKGADQAEEFFSKLGSGTGLEIGNPIYTLRERFMADLTHQGRADRLGPKQKLAFLIRAWNGWHEGEYLTRMMWVAGGAHPDKFPRVKGWVVEDPKDTAVAVEGERPEEPQTDPEPGERTPEPSEVEPPLKPVVDNPQA